MTRLATVLANALRTKNGPQPTERFTDQLLAAIPDAQREAMEVGLLLAEVAARRGAPWRVRFDTTAHGATYVSVVKYGGDDWEVSADGPVAALTALLERLGDPS